MHDRCLDAESVEADLVYRERIDLFINNTL